MSSDFSELSHQFGSITVAIKWTSNIGPSQDFDYHVEHQYFHSILPPQAVTSLWLYRGPQRDQSDMQSLLHKSQYS